MIKMLLPILYLFIGYIFSLKNIQIKMTSSTMLSKFVIPYVIIHHIVLNQNNMFVIVIAIIIVMSVMLLLARLFSSKPVELLCFSYLNIGWLGLPIATALFGEVVAGFVIAIYVGSSLFGNIIGSGLLAEKGTNNLSQRAIIFMKSPPFIALVLGVLLIPFAKDLAIIDVYIYDPAKFLMTFLGMMILGMWLAETKIIRDDILKSIIFSLVRILVLFGLTWSILLLSEQNNINWVTQYSSVLYLLCLLPPAANIVILETYYLKTGTSASMIAIGTCFSIVLIVMYTMLVIF